MKAYHTLAFKIFIVLASPLLFLSSTKERTDDEIQDRATMLKILTKSLENELLDVWYPRNFDSLYGGYKTMYTYNWKETGDQRKMIVSQARHMWVNSKSHEMDPTDKRYRYGASLGLRMLKDHMWDTAFGGFYTLMSREGTPIDQSKNAHGNSFAIFALAAYYKAFQDPDALKLAQKAFQWLEKNSHDAEFGGYHQHLNRDGSKIFRYNKIDTWAEMGYKDQNSSIHLLEAFTELYQVWPDPVLRERLNEMLVLIRDTIVTKEGYLQLFFTRDWRPVSYRDSVAKVQRRHVHLDQVSFGHDVETAFLMLEASHVLQIHDDKLTLKIAKKLLDHSLQYGWDQKAGGFYDGGYYFAGQSKPQILFDTKNWWAQPRGLTRCCCLLRNSRVIP